MLSTKASEIENVRAILFPQSIYWLKIENIYSIRSRSRPNWWKSRKLNDKINNIQNTIFAWPTNSFILTYFMRGCGVVGANASGENNLENIYFTHFRISYELWLYNMVFTVFCWVEWEKEHDPTFWNWENIEFNLMEMYHILFVKKNSSRHTSK